MKFKCEKQSLLQALQTVTGVATQKDIYPVLGNVKVTAQDNSLLFKATDLKISLIYTPTSTKFSVEEPGDLLVPAFKFCNVIKETPDNEVIVESEEFDARVKCEDGTFKILGENPEKFPNIPEFGESEYVEVVGKDFQKLIKKTLFATTAEKTRYDLDNVMVSIKDETLKFVATDGKRLAICEKHCEAKNNSQERVFTVPCRSLQQIDRVLNTTAPEKVKLGFLENQLLFQTEEVVLSTRLSEAKFPPYERVIPKGLAHKAFIKAKDFSSALRRMGWFTDEKNKTIELEFAEEKLSFFAADEGVGEASMEMAMVFEGSPFKIKFNPDFFLDMLKVTDSPEITILLKDFTSAALIKDGEDFQYVVLPIKPQEIGSE